jgi:hypothetical protein
VLGDHPAGGLDLAEGLLVGNLDVEEALDGPLFVGGRIQQVDPDRILRDFGGIGRGGAPAVDLQHRPVRLRFRFRV